MSTSVETSLASLKATTAQIHKSLILWLRVREHEKGPYMPGIIASCSKELMRVRSMTPRVWPNWHSIGHDDPRVLKHSWRSKIRAWEALGDHSGDLPVMPNPSIGPITVDLPSPPVIAGNVAGSSTHATSELRDKGKEPEVEGSRKRKSPMMWTLFLTSEVGKKGRKRVKATRHVKRRCLWSRKMMKTQLFRDASFPSFTTFPKEAIFGPASLIAGSPPKVMATSGSRPEVSRPPRQCPALRLRNLQSWIQVIFSFPAQTTPAIIAPRRSGPAPLGWTGGPVPHVCRASAAPPRRSNVSQHPWDPRQNIRGKSTTRQARSRTPSRAPSNAPAASQSKARTRSQSRGPSGTPAVPAVLPHPRHSPVAQQRQSLPQDNLPTCPSFYSVFKRPVPRPALDVPMPDLHSMAIAIRDGAARIALLEARVAEQDGMEPPSPKVQPASIIEGLIFELSQIQPGGHKRLVKLWTQMIRATLSQNMILMIWMLR
ncbi:hypothetical protein BDR07DRAFT_1384240 [Suillus spraguei]|nr:hypothetical protein BDR07DRAFT_1384240 [Suillus spraguei]